MRKLEVWPDNWEMSVTVVLGSCSRVAREKMLKDICFLVEGFRLDPVGSIFSWALPS